MSGAGRPAGHQRARAAPLSGVAALLAGWSLMGVAFLLFGFALLLGGVAALLVGWTLTGCHSCCSESRPC
jgi:hypothetical protein